MGILRGFFNNADFFVFALDNTIHNATEKIKREIIQLQSIKWKKKDFVRWSISKLCRLSKSYTLIFLLYSQYFAFILFFIYIIGGVFLCCLTSIQKKLNRTDNTLPCNVNAKNLHYNELSRNCDKGRKLNEVKFSFFQTSCFYVTFKRTFLNNVISIFIWHCCCFISVLYHEFLKEK